MGKRRKMRGEGKRERMDMWDAGCERETKKGNGKGESGKGEGIDGEKG